MRPSCQVLIGAPRGKGLKYQYTSIVNCVNDVYFVLRKPSMLPELIASSIKWITAFG